MGELKLWVCVFGRIQGIDLIVKITTKYHPTIGILVLAWIFSEVISGDNTVSIESQTLALFSAQTKKNLRTVNQFNL